MVFPWISKKVLDDFGEIGKRFGTVEAVNLDVMFFEEFIIFADDFAIKLLNELFFVGFGFKFILRVGVIELAT